MTTEDMNKKDLDMENAVKEARKESMAKSAFLSRVSHDMRTPLNAIISLSDRSFTDNASEDTRQKYLDTIHSSAKYLLEIINDVLDMSKIESNKMTLEPAPYSFAEFEHTINTIIGEQCRMKNQKLNIVINKGNQTIDNIVVDKVRFNQIFINLLSNAVKFTPEGGNIGIEIDCHSISDNEAAIHACVKDDGIGMSSDFIPLAFDSFSQENLIYSEQGTGLGLSIVKQLVTLMKGTINIESNIGEGSIFNIDMKVPYTKEPINDSCMCINTDIRAGIRVLLCEDHPLNTKIAKAILEKKHCIIDCAANGQEGLDKFLESEPFYYNLILMDILMPKMNGLEATRLIRQSQREDASTIPIIAMTGNAFDDDVRHSLDAGMNDHLTKPIKPDLIYNTISKYCN